MKVILHLLICLFLTILTQTGGVIWIISLFLSVYIGKTAGGAKKWMLNVCVFIPFYLIISLAVIPIIAPLNGRVALPFFDSGKLRPLNYLTVLLNRHYVQPRLKHSAINAAESVSIKFPGSVVNYLDANFPFCNGFPLFPHLSHNDGKKLDLAFFYIDNLSGKRSAESPSAIGYGVCEEPFPSENNMPQVCKRKGYWQYSLLTKLVSQGRKKQYKFDAERTRSLVNILVRDQSVGKIFLEPHLVSRLKLHSSKIRFHGCQAVRHDDHIHLQIK